MKPAHVFRLFDAAGNLLYVGISIAVPNGAIQRLKRDEPWGGQVKRWEITECPTKAVASHVLRQYIREQRPAHGRPRRVEAVAA